MQNANVPKANVIVTLYTKPECSLCDEVKADLQTLQQEIGFDFSECNIENDAALFEKFRYLIPVVDIDDSTMLYAPIYTHDLVEALARAKKS